VTLAVLCQFLNGVLYAMPAKLTKKEKAVFSERIDLISKEFDVGLSDKETARLEYLNKQASKICNKDMKKMFRKLRAMERALRKSGEKLAAQLSKLGID
jgi:hypothetical protein